jgi:hypothetical protein
MPAKGLQLLAFVAAATVAGASFAQEQPRDLLGGALDLKETILSPTPLGPPSEFKPPPAAAEKPEAAPAVTETEAPPPEAKSETIAQGKITGDKSRRKITRQEPRGKIASGESRRQATGKEPRRKITSNEPRRRTARDEPRRKPAVAARKPRPDPLESYARDTRPQIWPCVGDGICSWTPPWWWPSQPWR